MLAYSSTFMLELLLEEFHVTWRMFYSIFGYSLSLMRLDLEVFNELLGGSHLLRLDVHIFDHVFSPLFYYGGLLGFCSSYILFEEVEAFLLYKRDPPHLFLMFRL